MNIIVQNKLVIIFINFNLLIISIIIQMNYLLISLSKLSF